jgi:proton-coupled amino acid transporter
MSQPDVLANHQEPVLRASDLLEPGAFRRHFVRQQAETEGRSPPNILTRNFIDFLALYGFFGGDVYPTDDEFEEDDEEQGIPSEAEPLLNRSFHQASTSFMPPSALSRAASLSNVVGTTKKKAFFMIMKAFVGTGVLFLPKAFISGGLVFSVFLLILIGWLTLHCMLILVETSRELGGSFGDIALKLYGPHARQLVLGSIAVSQMGFSCAYYIFVAQNLRDWTMTVSNCEWILPDWVFIVIQLLVYIPLAWVRKIKHFSVSSLVADVFILLGLGYVLFYHMKVLGEQGISPDILMVNWQSFPLFVGTAIFAFEGICLILPIAESMKEPEKFGSVLTYCTLTIGVIFILIGASGYLTFGGKVETVIFLNLPTGSSVVPILQFFYAIAIMLSFPLTVYPAIRITEQSLFGTRNGKSSLVVKWEKNFYRASLVAFLAGVAWFGSNNLDKFVSLVGCFACIPLSFIYPSLFHYHITKSKRQRLQDLALVIFGTFAMFYTTYVTLQQWITTQPDIPKNRCA